MFCTKCGKELQNEANFCANCGHKVQAVVDSKMAEDPELIPITLPTVLNNVEFDAVGFAIKYQLFNRLKCNGIQAMKDLRVATNCKLSEATKCVTTLQKDEHLKQLVQTEEKRRADSFQAEADSLTGAFCPKCHSKHISIDKKGYSLGKGLVGAILVGPVGFIAGAHKANKHRFLCLNCGHIWK